MQLLFKKTAVMNRDDLCFARQFWNYGTNGSSDFFSSLTLSHTPFTRNEREKDHVTLLNENLFYRTFINVKCVRVFISLFRVHVFFADKIFVSE